MGWILRITAFFVGLVALALGLWPVTLVCVGYLVYSLWPRTKRVYVLKDDARPQRRQLVTTRMRYGIAVFLFILAFIALAAGGTYAPLFFGGIGLAVIFWPSVSSRLGLSRVKPIPDSILLRSTFLPFSWVCLVELKLGTPKMAKALSAVGEKMIIVISDKASFYLPVGVLALDSASAEARAVEKLGLLTRSLGPRGAFPLPLESGDASSRLGWALKPVKLELDDVASLQSTPFNVLVLNPSGHVIDSAGAYVLKKTVEEEKKGEGATTEKSEGFIPPANQKPSRPPLLWEALDILEEKFGVSEAYSYTTFLSSVCATQGEAVGDRLVNEGESGHGGKVFVSSLDAPRVELSKSQLRAIVRAYG